MADVITQAYLQALRRNIPDKPEESILLGIPLNV